VFGGAGGTSFELVDTVVTGNGADFGGGVSLSGSDTSITLLRSTVSDDDAADFGGGIYSGGTLVFVESTISGNETASFAGGAFTGFDSSFVTPRSRVTQHPRVGGSSAARVTRRSSSPT